MSPCARFLACASSLLVASILVLPLAAQETPAIPANAVPQGTVFLIQLGDKLDTRTARAGDHFQARLAEPLTTENGRLSNPAGRFEGTSAR